ncbi:hypothetical protein G9A89_010503 [Geosiphon pyriformis]|nr:hypothetical protein G9A89_010503 [Geosiphon pyriformis]
MSKRRRIIKTENPKSSKRISISWATTANNYTLPRAIPSSTSRPQPTNTETNAHLTALAPELFIHICKFVPPEDLISLSHVCRKFYGYLTSESCTSTNVMWRESRLGFLEHFSVPPPTFMSEQEYIKLIIGKGCQLCPERRPRTYWISWTFLASQPDIESKYGIPSKIFLALPYIDNGGNPFYNMQFNTASPMITRKYWLPQAKKLHQEYLLTGIDERPALLKKRQNYAFQLMSTQHDRWRNELMFKHSQIQDRQEAKSTRREEIKRRVEIMLKETLPDGTLCFERNWILNFSEVYRKALKAPSTRPFTNRAWSIFRGKLVTEYNCRTFDYE